VYALLLYIIFTGLLSRVRALQEQLTQVGDLDEPSSNVSLDPAAQVLPVQVRTPVPCTPHAAYRAFVFLHTRQKHCAEIWIAVAVQYGPCLPSWASLSVSFPFMLLYPLLLFCRSFQFTMIMMVLLEILVSTSDHPAHILYSSDCNQGRPLVSGGCNFPESSEACVLDVCSVKG